MPSAPHDLRTDTTLTPDPEVPGRVRADISEAWKVMYVFGGVSMYSALRAMQETLDRPELPLVTANAIFLAPVTPGPITIDVDVLRDGRNASQVAADLRVGDREASAREAGIPPSNEPRPERPAAEGGKSGKHEQVALRAHGVFGVTHDVDLAYQDVVCPEVPRPQDVPPPPDNRPNPFGEINFHQQTEWRPVSPLDDPGSGRFMSWVRLVRGEPHLLALAVHGDVLGPAVGRALGPLEHPFMVLSLEIGIRFITTPVTSWVLQEMEAWHVGNGYATGPARLWDEEGRLCAIANQTAHVRVFKQGVPPT